LKIYVDCNLLFWNILEYFGIFWNILDFLLLVQPTVTHDNNRKKLSKLSVDLIIIIIYVL
jgi:hypothetical protein